jgi:hypothetical protein
LSYPWKTKKEGSIFSKEIYNLLREASKNPNSDDIFLARQIASDDDRKARESLIAIMEITKKKNIRKYDKSLLGLSGYLFSVEGGYAGYMNFFCILLISQGHDLYDFFMRKFVYTFEDVANVNMQTKELFLKEHNLDLFNKGYNRKIRNSIAHCDFEIENDGTVKIKGEKIDIYKEIFKLIDFMMYVHGIIISSMEKIEKELKKKHNLKA